MTAEQARFEKKLEQVKGGLRPSFAWYPYWSMGNVEHWEELLGPKRSVQNLAAGGEVLDLGCGDGTLAFFLESLGCQVEAVDLPATNYNQMKGIRILKEAFRSRITISEMDLDRQFTLDKAYSLVLFLGLLYHLKNPFYVLETLAHHARFCILSTRVAAKTPSGKAIDEEPVAYLLDEDEANGDCTNFWIFSEAGLRRLANRTGWNVKAYQSFGCRADSNPRDGDRDERAFCLLESRYAQPRLPVRLLEGWHEMEDNWRWTERRFGVVVPAPVSRQENQLEFRFHHIHDFPVTIVAAAEGHRLSPQTFATAGEHVYRAEIPQSALANREIHVEFELDRALEGQPDDPRERGLIVSFFRAGYWTGEQNLPLTFS